MFDFDICLQDKPGTYFLKGAYEQVIRLCSSYNSRGSTLSLNGQQRELYQQQLQYMGTAGLRGALRPPGGLGRRVGSLRTTNHRCTPLLILSLPFSSSFITFLSRLFSSSSLSFSSYSLHFPPSFFLFFHFPFFLPSFHSLTCLSLFLSSSSPCSFGLCVWH